MKCRMIIDIGNIVLLYSAPIGIICERTSRVMLLITNERTAMNFRRLAVLSLDSFFDVKRLAGICTKTAQNAAHRCARVQMYFAIMSDIVTIGNTAARGICKNFWLVDDIRCWRMSKEHTFAIHWQNVWAFKASVIKQFLGGCLT